jgi:hypothetical protein
MDEGTTNDDRAECATTPFDDFSEKRGPRVKRGLHLAAIARMLRVLSAVALAFAVVTAFSVIALDAAHWRHLGASWQVKTALPLIGIGVSYALLQFTLPRTLTEFCLSLAVSLAFILWGAEQFMHTAWIIALVDDFVAFLFVLDLGIVIRGHLTRKIDRS